MVSVALIVGAVPIRRLDWSTKMLREAKRAAYGAIENVGIKGSDVTEGGSITFVVRRQCTDEERKQVLEKYLQV